MGSLQCSALLSTYCIHHRLGHPSGGGGRDEAGFCHHSPVHRDRLRSSEPSASGHLEPGNHTDGPLWLPRALVANVRHPCLKQGPWGPGSGERAGKTHMRDTGAGGQSLAHNGPQQMTGSTPLQGYLKCQG